MCRLIGNAELVTLTRGELSALFRKLSDELATSEPNSPARRKCLGSLENISRALNKPKFR